MSVNSGRSKSDAIVSADPDNIAALAYLYWHARGCPAIRGPVAPLLEMVDQPNEKIRNYDEMEEHIARTR